jgi:hypothetical protein
LGAILSSATLVSATSIIYNVDRTIGAGSITGFIETDGATGPLSAADFVDWNLLLNVGPSTFDLMGPLSGNNSVVFVRGGDTQVFGTQLMFNFSGIDNGTFLFQQGLFSPNHYYCDASQPAPCFPGETVVPISLTVGYQNVNLHGVMVIGNEAGTPEPGACLLFMTGLGFVVRRGRLRSHLTPRC